MLKKSIGDLTRLALNGNGTGRERNLLFGDMPQSCSSRYLRHPRGVV